MSPQGPATVDVHVRTKGSRWGIVAAKVSRVLPERAERAFLAWSLRRLRYQTRIGKQRWTTLPSRVWWEGDALYISVSHGDPVEVGRKL